jgi:hypothetical protein
MGRPKRERREGKASHRAYYPCLYGRRARHRLCNRFFCDSRERGDELDDPRRRRKRLFMSGQEQTVTNKKNTAK